MTDRDEIYQGVVRVLGELFEVEPAEVSLDSHLYQDLDIDSIDAVDLVVEIKKITGQKIKPEDFKNVRTVGDIVDAVSELMNNQQ
ncbi:acyl carrier protein [Gilvimarinus sp. F26214L]|uniref:acyl carrier protein n=1 Tax=Gilvimarinus sp. DZF01 TaxID=3461371 RepID=UPI00404644A0